ncbi:MAG: hypothetical protein DMG07_28340 [Acidobacteria bacterium]|nr:MAG: hypothetical protein DMG07_28340 [Acidobacteriota bacterium]
MEIVQRKGVAAPVRGHLGLVLLLGLLGALFFYKWSGSIRTIDGVRAAHAWTRSADPITTGGVLRATAAYFGRIWPALLYGLLIGAAVRALVSPRWFAELLGNHRAVRRQIAAGLAGAPLMLCSCCITPLFASVYETGVRLGPALGMMLGSPGLNPAALVLTFMLFPPVVAATRLASAAAAVFVLPVVLERMFGASLTVAQQARSEPEPPRPGNFGQFALAFARGFVRLSVTTVPLIAAGVLVSSLILPISLHGSLRGALIGVPVVSALSVLVALPTFFEIPLALVLVQLAGPAAAVPMLFAGPIVNLPSLLILARQTSAKVALSLGAGIWLLALAAGLLVQLSGR